MQDILFNSESVAKTQLNLYWNTPWYAISESDHIKSISLADLAYWMNDSKQRI